MANYYVQCQNCGRYSNVSPCYDCLEKENARLRQRISELETTLKRGGFDMCDSKIIEKCCGTCRRWQQMDRHYGICRLAKNVTDNPIKRRNDMTGCLGWKEADPWDLEKRGYETSGKQNMA